MQETHFLSTSNPKPFSSISLPNPNPNPKSQFQSSSSSHHDPSFHSPKTPHFPILSTKTKTKTPSSSSPQILKSLKPQIPPPPSDFHDKALYLDSIGLDLFSLLHHHPPIVSASLPDLKSTVHFLTSMGFSAPEFRRLVGMCPEILASRVSDIIPIFTFLLREARVNGSDLKRVINRRPRLLASSVKHRLRPTLYFLQSIGIADVNKHTSLLSCSVEDKLQPRVDYLEKIGFSRRDALAMFRRFPQLFCYSIEHNFEPKFNYFVVEMGRELKELKEFPHYFSFSLENRIRPRHQRCVEKGVCFPLPILLKTSEAKFRERLEVCCNSSIPLRNSPLWCTNSISGDF
ncbi:protein SEEDLING LETHAL 1, chloroplastic [Rosa sericea]